MPLLTKVGSFNKINVTGQQAVTGVGFTPKAIIFWASGAGPTSGTWETQNHGMLGFTTGPTNSFAVGTFGSDGASTTDTTRRMAAKCIAFPDSTSGSWGDADLVSFDADGFTINWTANVAGSLTDSAINYMVLGGSDITGAKIVNWAQPTAVGNLSVAGVGFKPDLVLHAHIGGAAPPVTHTFTRFNFGAMNKHGQQWTNAVASADAVSPSNTSRWQQTDACLGQIDEGEVLRSQAHFVSMDTDGFTLNFSSQVGAVSTISLCLKGVSSKIGAFPKTTAAAPAAQSITRCGFLPKAVLFSNTQDAAKAAPIIHAIWGLGAATATDQRLVHLVDLDASNPTQVDSLFRSDASIYMGAPAATDAQGSLTGMDADGFSVSFSPNHAQETEVLFLALGDAGVSTYPTRVG